MTPLHILRRFSLLFGAMAYLAYRSGETLAIVLVAVVALGAIAGSVVWMEMQSRARREQEAMRAYRLRVAATEEEIPEDERPAS